MAKKQFLGNKASFGGFQYKWSPSQDLPKDIEVRRAARQKGKEYKNFCNAVPFSQGIDNVVLYVYESASSTEHLAYVECGYVK
jgi:hypothetical protein